MDAVIYIFSAGATIRRTRWSPRAQAKRGAQKLPRGERNVPKITKEECKTYENWLKRGANLINEEVLKDKKNPLEN